jgi:mannose-6-phosphate isomerase-like protein (cupin superfamily)
MTDPVEPFAVGSDERPRLVAPAGEISVLVGTDESDGSMNVFEFWCPAGSGPALHAHTREDELWFVLEGEFRFKAGEAMLRAETGGLAYGPRGVPHAFQNIGESPGRLLIVTTPGGIQPFFEEIGERWLEESGPELLAEVGAKLGMTFEGPPLAISDP